MNGKMYFLNQESRQKAYKILTCYNFFFPYGKSCSLTDIEDLGYMIELLEFSGFDISKVLWEEVKD